MQTVPLAAGAPPKLRLLKAAALAAKSLAKSEVTRSTPDVGEDSQSSAQRTQELNATEENVTTANAATAASTRRLT